MTSRALKYPPVYDPIPLTFTQRIVRLFFGAFLVPYILNKIWKRVLHIITGRSEIERILLSPNTADRSLHYSTKLNTVKTELHGEDSQAPTVATQICAIKHIKPSLDSPVYRKLEESMENMRQYRQLVATIVANRAVKYDTSNEQHEILLEKLWDLLRPNVRREGGRYSKDWQEIGFQSTDPATDFRGAGVFGLQNLVSFAEKYPKAAREILDAGNLPIAITGLQVTALISQWMVDGKLQPHFLFHGSSTEQFVHLYARIFYSFWRMFSESGAKTIMDFPPIWKRFCSALGWDLHFSLDSAFASPVLASSKDLH